LQVPATKRSSSFCLVALLLFPLIGRWGVAQEEAKVKSGYALDSQRETNSGPGPDANRARPLQERNSLYRLEKSDVLELNFTFAPEFNQTIAVQPDGYIGLRGARQILAVGLTIPELVQRLHEEYSAVLRDPQVAVVLKEFEKPYFVVAGEVVRPGRYELRGVTTLTQALALAGGFTNRARPSQVFLFRRISAEWAEVRKLNAKQIFSATSGTEDVELRSGDLLFVPQSKWSKIRPFMPTASLGLFFRPTGF
jgi:polysaccharide export outer membrane protein